MQIEIKGVKIMAYIGRGSSPNQGKGSHFYTGRIHYYIPLDNTYVIMQMIVTFIILIEPFGIKLDLDNTYTPSKFEQFFTEQNATETINKKSKIDIGMTGVSIKTEKEYYIDECIKLYNIFKIKSCGTLGLHFLLNILLIYQIIKFQKTKENKNKYDKDNLILFDEEQNVKI